MTCAISEQLYRTIIDELEKNLPFLSENVASERVMILTGDRYDVLVLLNNYNESRKHLKRKVSKQGGNISAMTISVKQTKTFTGIE